MFSVVTQTSKIHASEALKAALAEHGISPQDYKPAYGGESAALDLYNAGSNISIPSFLEGFFSTMIPTGLHVCMMPGTVGVIKERGSISKTPLILRAGVLDVGFSGEAFVNVVNLSDATYHIAHAQKLPFQLLVYRTIPFFELVTTQQFQEWHRGSLRQSGAVGSSD